MGFLLGIDGGGTQTVALLADREQNVLARAEDGPTNVQSVGIEAVEETLGSLLSRLCAPFGGIEAVDAACVGLAGVGRDRDLVRMRPVLERLGFPERTLLTHDARIALVGGADEDRGVLLIAGTGSIAYGRNAEGVEARCGGWGHLLGDEGSGYALGLGALRATMRAADGRSAPSPLTDAVLEMLDLFDPTWLVDWSRVATKGEIAAMSRSVFAALERDDAVARRLVEEGAEALAEMAIVVLRRLDWEKPPIVVLSGGLFAHHPSYRECVARRIVRQYGDVAIRPPRNAPAYGALTLARALLPSE